jgi:hypothetical protein
VHPVHAVLQCPEVHELPLLHLQEVNVVHLNTLAHRALREALARVLDEEPDLEVVLQADPLSDLGDLDPERYADI